MSRAILSPDSLVVFRYVEAENDIPERRRHLERRNGWMCRPYLCHNPDAAPEELLTYEVEFIDHFKACVFEDELEDPVQRRRLQEIVEQEKRAAAAERRLLQAKEKREAERRKETLFEKNLREAIAAPTLEEDKIKEIWPADIAVRIAAVRRDWTEERWAGGPAGYKNSQLVKAAKDRLTPRVKPTLPDLYLDDSLVEEIPLLEDTREDKNFAMARFFAAKARREGVQSKQPAKIKRMLEQLTRGKTDDEEE